jgi:predicted GH43/DUF377 family glycosyl hydrolase
MAGKRNIQSIPNIKLVLERFSGNPILTPNKAHPWESVAVFNPAAIYEDGKVHILYRALGNPDVSTLGYASSPDGLHITERLPYPAYVPREPFEGVTSKPARAIGTMGIYTSGGGEMGGCEDPRLTRIGDTVHITYVAYNGYSQPRIALSSISYNDFLNKRWDWKRPVLISAPGIVDKNACLLPEKINGKYVIFHRVFPNILIDFVDDLDFDGKTRWLTGQYEIPVRALSSDWDSRKVGCGPPPLKTKDGWLLIYQAVGAVGEYRYKIGAMLLDLKDPTKVLARSRNPILEPDAWYENEGLKSGVVYPCGAVIIDKRLFVYYGGADMVTCVASVKLNGFLEQLCNGHQELEVKKIPDEEPAEEERKPLEVKGFCLKCKKIKTIHNPQQVIMGNMKVMVKGICPRCGAKIATFVPVPHRNKKTAVKKAKGPR